MTRYAPHAGSRPPRPDTEILLLGERPRWQARAACLDEDANAFFPVGTTGPALDHIAQAKTVCARCEVRDQCLEWALQTGQDAGIWGGMTEDDRRALRRARARRQKVQR